MLILASVTPAGGTTRRSEPSENDAGQLPPAGVARRVCGSSIKTSTPSTILVAGAAACVANDRLLDKVINDVQSGQMLGVRFTPTVFINEQNYGNPGGADAIAAILRQVGR